MEWKEIIKDYGSVFVAVIGLLSALIGLLAAIKSARRRKPDAQATRERNAAYARFLQENMGCLSA